MSVITHGSGSAWMSIRDANHFERKLVADYSRALLTSTKTAANFIVRPSHEFIFILRNQINPPNSRSSRLLAEHLEIRATFRIISAEEKELYLVGNGVGRSERAIALTGFNPEVLPFALKQEVYGGKNLTLDPQVLIALPLVIKEFADRFSTSLRDHIVSCTVKHIQANQALNSNAISSNPNILLPNSSSREAPHIPVQFENDAKKTIYNLTDILETIKKNGESEHQLAYLKPVTATDQGTKTNISVKSDTPGTSRLIIS